MNIELLKPTIVLVHGALEDASIWHGVIPWLQRDGYPVIVFANPLRGVAVDAAYLRSVLDRNHEVTAGHIRLLHRASTKRLSVI